MGRISGPSRKWTVLASEVCETRSEADQKAEPFRKQGKRTRITYNTNRDRGGRRLGNGGFYVLYVYET